MRDHRQTLPVALALAAALTGCGGGTLHEIQRVTSGTLQIIVLSEHPAIQHGRDTFVIEFRSVDGMLVDVGDVKASATMPMPGTPMFGSLEAKRADAPGRYSVTSDFSMAGTWRLTFEWNGQAGPGAVTLSGSIQ